MYEISFHPSYTVHVLIDYFIYSNSNSLLCTYTLTYKIEVHEPSVACDGMSPSELEESILPPPIFHTNQPMPMCGGYDQVV